MATKFRMAIERNRHSNDGGVGHVLLIPVGWGSAIHRRSNPPLPSLACAGWTQAPVT